jgi:hypothetical protein
MVEPRQFEAFDCAPGLRLQAHERLAAVQLEGLTHRLARIEEEQERLERRLWLAVYGVAAAILANAFQSILTVVP